MTFVTNAGALAARKRVLAGKTAEAFRAVAQGQGKEMVRVAESLSAGTLTAAALQKAGHPYARRRVPGSAGVADFIINKQSGDFAAAWHSRAQKTRQGWTVTVWNDDKAAAYLMGTSKMRVRPILDEVVRRCAAGLPAGVRKATHKAAEANGASGSGLGAILYGVGVGLASAAGGAFDAAGE